MIKKKFTRLRRMTVKQPTVTFEEVHNMKVMPYDENLLERARTQWQFGDWSNLARIERESLQHHPERAKLALLAAAGRLQTGDLENARSFVQLAKDWGCGRQLISQILVAGVHNSLGRALALTMNQGRAIQQFKKALEIGMPGGDSKLLSRARMLQQENEEDQYSNPEVTLAELYSNHTGYVSDKWELYLQVYEKIFSFYRGRPVSLLEIGVQNGGSLEIWNKFFKNAKIIAGCDIEEKCRNLIYSSDKIRLAIGDVKSRETQDLIVAISNQYDIIIDDGSHKSSDIVNAFCSLFPILKQGGVYVVEDMHCSYWKAWEGGLDEPKSSISFFKNLVDFINREHWEQDFPKNSWLDDRGLSSLDEDFIFEIHSVKFYNSMCIVEKRKRNDNILGVRHVVGMNENICEVKKYNGMLSRGMG